MTKFNQINPEQAEGDAKEVLDKIKSKLGGLPNIFKVMAQAPAVVEAYLGFSGALAKSSLSAQQREAIALAVAAKNKCEYCAAAHSAMGQRAGLSGEDISAALNGKSSDPKTQALVSLALRIVGSSGHLSEQEHAELETSGLTQQEIIETIAVVSLNIFTNYFNHIAEPEIDFPRVALPSSCSCCCGH